MPFFYVKPWVIFRIAKGFFVPVNLVVATNLMKVQKYVGLLLQGKCLLL